MGFNYEIKKKKGFYWKGFIMDMDIVEGKTRLSRSTEEAINKFGAEEYHRRLTIMSRVAERNAEKKVRRDGCSATNIIYMAEQYREEADRVARQFKI